MKAKIENEGTTGGSDLDERGGRIYASGPSPDIGVLGNGEIASLKAPCEKDAEIRHPWIPCPIVSVEKHQEHIDFELRELLMHGAQVELVESQGLAINIPSVGAVVTIRAKGDEVFIIVGATSFPRDDVVNFHFDVAATWDCASMPSFNKNAPLNLCGNSGTPIVAR